MLIPGALRHRGTPATLGEGAGAYLLSLVAANLCWTRALRHPPDRYTERSPDRPVSTCKPMNDPHRLSCPWTSQYPERSVPPGTACPGTSSAAVPVSNPSELRPQCSSTPVLRLGAPVSITFGSPSAVPKRPPDPYSPVRPAGAVPLGHQPLSSFQHWLCLSAISPTNPLNTGCASRPSALLILQTLAVPLGHQPHSSLFGTLSTFSMWCLMVLVLFCP